jgi:hypothetical protein
MCRSSLRGPTLPSFSWMCPCSWLHCAITKTSKPHAAIPGTLVPFSYILGYFTNSHVKFLFLINKWSKINFQLVHKVKVSNITMKYADYWTAINLSLANRCAYFVEGQPAAYLSVAHMEQLTKTKKARAGTSLWPQHRRVHLRVDYY